MIEKNINLTDLRWFLNFFPNRIDKTYQLLQVRVICYQTKLHTANVFIIETYTEIKITMSTKPMTCFMRLWIWKLYRIKGSNSNLKKISILVILYQWHKFVMKLAPRKFNSIGNTLTKFLNLNIYPVRKLCLWNEVASLALYWYCWYLAWHCLVNLSSSLSILLAYICKLHPSTLVNLY